MRFWCRATYLLARRPKESIRAAGGYSRSQESVFTVIVQSLSRQRQVVSPLFNTLDCLYCMLLNKKRGFPAVDWPVLSVIAIYKCKLIN